MRKFILLAVLSGTGLLPVYAQRTLKDIDEKKYRINLPDHWKPHSKAIQVLSEVLPNLCPELKDKDLCGDDCNPAWTIEFYITEPELVSFETHPKNTSATSTNTNTRSSFVRSDIYISPASPQLALINNNLVNRPVNSIDTRKEIVSYFNFQCFLLLADREQKIITRLILVDTNEVWKKVQLNTTRRSSASNPENGISLLPATEELLAIADKKILALGKGE